MKNGVNKIENQGENWYKMFQNGQMTEFGEKLYQLILSLDLNVIETTRFFFCRKNVSIRLNWA